MTTVLYVLVVVAVAFVSVAEAGAKTKTPKCNECDWEIKVKTADDWQSGTDCNDRIQIRIHTEDGESSLWQELKTSKNDFMTGRVETFRLGIANDYVKVKYYLMGTPTEGCSLDKWQPEWTELRKKGNPELVSGRCTYKGIWVGVRTAIKCEGNSGSEITLDNYNGRDGVKYWPVYWKRLDGS